MGLTPPVIQRWVDVVENHSGQGLGELLAEDAVFHPPARFAPQEGRDKAAACLSAAGKLFGGNDFRYVGQWYAERSAVLEFTVSLDGIHINGIDMIEWNDAGQITSVKVMLRPVKALQAVMPKMAELLQSR
ncbi:nuclear transport factor 2 family protein [Mycobacterium sp. Y57]|uniref:nuclear transport factor 2 family protein n=1 Tax=Mycolicibacterium xanthum TaxID=2796469 RepID=UPI001C844629|nr:nuclear transport factor 2 family protein [Mycolicibacterium xanthum]MBX7430623.1 nuclear transport factor 2 family protein [Mycolicibacterium xanthum]